MTTATVSQLIRLTPYEKAEAARRHVAGETFRKIADDLGVSVTSVFKAVKKKGANGGNGNGHGST